MCGIVCYVGPRPCSDIIFNSLKKLEYRGYDSAGIAIHDQTEIKVLRAEGKLENLGRAMAETPLNGTIGIGHTRWATHGKPSEANAHPHLVDDIAVVHNGILENYGDLRHELLKAGVELRSDTDTELIAQLLGQDGEHEIRLGHRVAFDGQAIAGAA